MIWRCLAAFYKLTVFWVVMGLSEDLSVRALKCRSDDKHHKISNDSEACESILQIGHILSRNEVK